MFIHIYIYIYAPYRSLAGFYECFIIVMVTLLRTPAVPPKIYVPPVCKLTSSELTASELFLKTTDIANLL